MDDGPKAEKNFSIALPLLVVHSGNMTKGLVALVRNMSNVWTLNPVPAYGGQFPVKYNILRSETRSYPLIGILLDGARVVTAAEPVPVRRPGVTIVSFRTGLSGSSEGTGSKKIGSNLPG